MGVGRNHDLVRLIWRMYFECDRSRGSAARIAKELGLSVKVVCDIIAFRSWKSVAFPIVDEEAGLSHSIDYLYSLDPFLLIEQDQCAFDHLIE